MSEYGYCWYIKGFIYFFLEGVNSLTSLMGNFLKLIFYYINFFKEFFLRFIKKEN